jgi:hypothetical protein
MPTTRTRVSRGRTDLLNLNQRSILTTGCECFPAWPGFEDDEHREEAWAANRAQILAEWCHPGRRPDAFWEFDLSLEQRDGYRVWRWPEPIQSEAEMVYRLLEASELEPCRFNGAVRIDSELRVIQEEWLREIRIGLIAVDRVPQITKPLPTWGAPVWFYQEHAPRIVAELQGR